VPGGLRGAELFMNDFLKAVVRRGMPLLALATAATGAASPAQATLLPQSWNGYHWAHTGNLAIMIGNNASAGWASYLAAAEAKWSTDKYIDYLPTKGMTSASSCGSVYGTVQVCSGNYGSTGWLGYTQVWASGTQITAATIKLNDYYFSQTRYNIPAFHQQVACQEMGNALGLDDLDRVFTNANAGTCMDYTNDPTGTKGTNGTLANTTTDATDISRLDAIYAVKDSTQLIYTKPGLFGNAQALAAVPEPASWITMIAGFLGLGLSLRRSRKAAVQA